jgi:hypothetical protein
MLTRDEILQVQSILADFLGLGTSIRNLIQVVYPTVSQPILLALPTDLSNVNEQSSWLVRYLVATGWPIAPAAPSHLEELLEYLIPNAPAPALQPLWQRVHNRIDPHDPVFDSHWLLADLPFLDRRPIRASVRQLIADFNRPILRVNGPRYSGKSYTIEYLNYLAAEGPPHLNFASSAVKPENAPSYDPVLLAEELTLSMQTDGSVPEPTSSSYARTLSNWIVRNTLRQQGLWIFALDGFGDENLPLTVRQLVDSLAEQVLITSVSRRLRLVLIDHSRALPGNGDFRSIPEQVPPPANITAADIEDCIVEHNRRRLANPAGRTHFNPSEIPALASGLLSKSPPQPEARLAFLKARLNQLASL